MDFDEGNQATYQSLSDLITTLSKDNAQYGGILHSMGLPISTFKPFCSWSHESYTRNCIFHNEEFELILLCWEEGPKTPIHDHGGEECWVKVVQGELTETIYSVESNGELRPTKRSISKTGNVSYMVDFMGCHSLENSSGGRAMSLHLYAKPIGNCQIFCKDSEEFVRKDLAYDTISDLATK